MAEEERVVRLSLRFTDGVESLESCSEKQKKHPRTAEVGWDKGGGSESVVRSGPASYTWQKVLNHEFRIFGILEDLRPRMENVGFLLDIALLYSVFLFLILIFCIAPTQI